MADISQQQGTVTLEEYKHRLQREWTRPVACQDQCLPLESCRCLRHIIHVDALVAWLGRKLTEVSGSTNLHRLLAELQLGDHRTFPLDFETYFTGEFLCVRVFSLLLKQNRGHLIDRFYQSQMYDVLLHQNGNYEGLRENLSDTIIRNDIVDRIIEDFQREKWAFCPLELQLHMDRPLDGTRVIAPFCHKIRLNEGGTASVYLVAVQKDLVRDERLRAVLNNSLYVDSVFGECYKMALKSYCGNKKSAFESEKDAFSALKSNIDVPIVRYLGSFTHDYGEGITSTDHHARKTYNLLLEYGELDLYQYWADETNVPPVRVNEIIRYWEQLFEVAIAIRQVHHLDVSQGKSAPLSYYGWHADIKPDNILLVNGRFKLADFGFSRFAPVAKSKSGTAPTEYIHGFTDTYGAPEISRMKQPNGTTSEVTQTIDTWSFGCVLSVAATWVVLGFQGVRQYEKLRRLSPANKKGSKTYERFHNGTDVLPEIKKWHNYLRGHLRPSDTATSMVLDVIEHNMLQTETYNRLDLKSLCKRLGKIIKDAKEEVSQLDIHTRTTDDLVLKALLKLEKEAQELSSRPKTTPLGKVSKGDDGSCAPLSEYHESLPLRKDAAIRSTPLGQTTFRKEILENELQGISFTGGKDVLPQLGGHQGEMTDSPIDAFPMSSSYFVRDESPWNYSVTSNEHHDQTSTPDCEKVYKTSLSSGASKFRTGITPPLSSGSEHASSGGVFTPNRHQTSSYYSPEGNSSPLTPSDRYDRVEQESPLARHSNRRSERGASQWPSETGADLVHSMPANFLPEAHRNELSNLSASEYRYPGTAVVAPLFTTSLQSPSPLYATEPQTQTDYVPQIREPIPRASQTYFNPIAPDSNFHRSAHSLSPVSPSITVTQHLGFSTAKMNETPSHSIFSPIEKEVVSPEEDNGMQYDELPSTIYELPYDICRIRKDIDNEKPKGVQSHIKRIFQGEERKVNSILKKAYGNDREIVLIVDNGWTMFKHWPIVTFVAETLAKNAAGLDKDGIDLMFTIDGETRNIPKIKGDTGRQILRQALDTSWPANSRSDDSLTDMAQIFADVYEKWKNKGQKATTLLVLTDGDWSRTDHPALNELLLDFARREIHRAGKRHFGIQFIRFGEDNKDKLSWLDDQLCQENQLKDIIDHCSWRTTVDKMFRGSIEGWHDQHDSGEQDITYCYSHLVTFFKSFNDGGSNALLPPERSYSTRQSISRSSSKGSMSDGKQRKHESAPPVQTNSWHRQHHKTYSEQYNDKEYMG